jgi:uncharacterized membrane protein YeaQ/YmgE (transglycosylase-associated protein family)
MKIFKAISIGLIVGFSATLLHNIYPPVGLIAALILTYLGVKVSGELFYTRKYQILTSLAWLIVVFRAGSPGFSDEILIYGNLAGNIFLVFGFLTLLIGIILNRSRNC